MPPEFGGKWETEYLNTMFPPNPTVCGIQREADFLSQYLNTSFIVYVAKNFFFFCYSLLHKI